MGRAGSTQNIGIQEKKPTPEESQKGVKLTEEELKKVVGSGEFDEVPTVDEQTYDDDIKERI